MAAFAMDVAALAMGVTVVQDIMTSTGTASTQKSSTHMHPQKATDTTVTDGSIAATSAQTAAYPTTAATPASSSAYPTSPIPKRSRWDDFLLIEQEVAEVSSTCVLPEADVHELLASSSSWRSRSQAARQVHLEILRKHGVYKCHPLPVGTRPLSVRWVDRDDATTFKSRLTARGFEQHLKGQEQVPSATPCAWSLRTLLVTAVAKGWSVSVGNCKDAFLQAPSVKDQDIWVWPPEGAQGPPGHAWLVLKTVPGLKTVTAAWSSHAAGVTQDDFGLTHSRADPCVCGESSRSLWP